MNILFVHGYGSSGETSVTGKDVTEIFPEFTVFKPTYDFINPNNAVKQLEDEIENTDFDLIVGISLGGFWADYLGKKYSIPTFLINPSINPETNLLKRDIDPNLIKDYAKYRLDPVPGLPMTVMLGTDDDVVAHEPSLNKYTGTAEVILVDGGKHRLNRNEYAAELKKAAYSWIQT